jgi:hypothetical protein
MSFCYVCSGRVQDTFSIFVDPQHDYWIISGARGSVQLAALTWNHFPAKRNHLRLQLFDAITSQIEETSQ